MTSAHDDRPASAPSHEDVEDFANANRGFIAPIEQAIVKNAVGVPVWNADAHSFVHDKPAPDTVNAGLWRQAQLLSKQGLYQISERIYQVRGLDISHITFIEGTRGIIVIDPLVSNECARAALDLYAAHRGERPVTGMIYTHSHIDHYGGAAGVLDPSDNPVSIIAPEGFMEEAISENVLLGPVMRRRAAHMYGARLRRSPTGQVGVGLGMGTSAGKTSLIPPNHTVTTTGEEMVVDGVRIIFQLVPNTEAPSEMNMYFPDDKALLIAECATHSMHNIITLRGAQVRDAKAWSRYLDETLQLFCEAQKSDVQFGSHGWPTFGETNIKLFIEEQRDLYAFIHDQTVRHMNAGLNGPEIAEILSLPPTLASRWHTQGFYGSVSHNVKGIYQRYLSWFDGAAEHLWKWPPKEEGTRYVKCMGGAQAVIKLSDQYVEEGDLRFAATLLGHLVAAGDSVDSPSGVHAHARQNLANVFQLLGFGAENATWRNFYLSQAMDLRQSTGQGQQQKQAPRQTVLGSIPRNLAIEQWLEGLSVSIDGVKAGAEEKPVRVVLRFRGSEELWLLILSNGALTYRALRDDGGTSVKRGDAVIEMTDDRFKDLLSGKKPAAEEVHLVSGGVEALDQILACAGLPALGRDVRCHL